ncbi:cyclin-D1-2-like [Pistacia vera]|uniref:cyclin-D1-2-like n=1 Tax=Pistacia vera TaxID=55513 RepID=UPI001263661B|nr:cyclin-D1-2-like [Pistacia vera]
MDMKIDDDRNNPVDGFEEEDLERYLEAEEEFMAAEGYAQSNGAILRVTAVRVILNSRLDNFDVFEQYLALTYFDRFISKNPLPNVIDCARDEVVLVVNCCLMIAYKMRLDSFDVHSFLVKTKMINHGRHVRIVELVILNALKWDLELTAISFVNLVIPRISGAENIKRRVVNEIIIHALGDKTVTEYRPSVIAAAAIMTACSLTLREMQPICYKWIVDTKFVDEVDLEACFVKFCQMCMDKKIIRKKDREAAQSPRVRAASRSPEKEPNLRISDTDAERIVERRHGKEPKLGSSDADTDRKFERRPGKEPMSLSKTKNKAVAVPENKIDDSESDDEINFKVKWILWITNPEEIDFDYPHFRNHNPQYRYRKAAHRKKIYRGYRGFLFSFD